MDRKLITNLKQYAYLFMITIFVSFYAYYYINDYKTLDKNYRIVLSALFILTCCIFILFGFFSIYIVILTIQYKNKVKKECINIEIKQQTDEHFNKEILELNYII